MSPRTLYHVVMNALEDDLGELGAHAAAVLVFRWAFPRGGGRGPFQSPLVWA